MWLLIINEWNKNWAFHGKVKVAKLSIKWLIRHCSLKTI